MNDRGSTCKFRNARSFSKFTRGSSVFHTPMRNKQLEFNPYIYTLSKLYRFGYKISVFNTNTRSLIYGGHYSSLHRLMSLHGKMDVKIFLMFIVAENTRSVILIWLKGTYSRFGPMCVYENNLTWNITRILRESHPKMYKLFWKGWNNKQSLNHSFVNIVTRHFCL